MVYIIIHNSYQGGFMKKLKCLRCGYEWYPRIPGIPRQCPNKKCHSLAWNRLRGENEPGPKPKTGPPLKPGRPRTA